MILSDRVRALAREADQAIEPVLRKIDETAQINTEKVLAAFQKNRVAEALFFGSTGYEEIPLTGSLRTCLKQKTRWYASRWSAGPTP